MAFSIFSSFCSVCLKCVLNGKLEALSSVHVNSSSSQAFAYSDEASDRLGSNANEWSHITCSCALHLRDYPHALESGLFQSTLCCEKQWVYSSVCGNGLDGIGLLSLLCTVICYMSWAQSAAIVAAVRLLDYCLTVSTRDRQGLNRLRRVYLDCSISCCPLL